MTLRDVTPEKVPPPLRCCSRQDCQREFPNARLGQIVVCDECGRYWCNSLLLGWLPDMSPRCHRCHERTPPGGHCDKCSPLDEPKKDTK